MSAVVRVNSWVDLGFDPAGVTVVTLNVGGYGYTDAWPLAWRLRGPADASSR